MHLRRLFYRVMLFISVVHTYDATAGLCAFETRTITSANGKYLLVLLTPAGEQESRWEKTIPEQDRIEAKYSQSGLYRNDGSTELLWPIEYLSTAKDIYVCDDGVHLVVAFLGWNSGISDRGHAIEFYKNGVRQATYDEQELLACYHTRMLASSISGSSWPEGSNAVFDEGSGTFAFQTNWGDAFQFDIGTGKLLNSRSPWSFKVLAGSIIGLLLLLGFVGWWHRSRAARNRECQS